MSKKISSESLVRAGLAILIAQGIFLLANFLYHFLSARFLGPEEYSIVASLFSIMYLITVGSAAIQNTTTKFTSDFKAKKEDNKVYSFFKKGFRKISIFSFILLIIYLIISPLIASFLHIPLLPIIISSPVIILFALIPFNRGILQGLQRFNALGLNMALEGIIRLIIAMGFIFIGLKANGALASVPIATGIALILTFSSLKFNKTKEKPVKLDSKEIYKFIITSLLALFLINAIYNMDIFLVKHFFSAEQAGHYAAISLLGKIVFFGATSIGLVMFPKISELHLKNSKKVKSFFIKSLIFTGIISVLITAIYFLFSRQIVLLLFGIKYLDIFSLIGVFGIFMTILSLSYICVLYKLAIGKKKFILILLLSVMLEIFLISMFHASLSQVILILIILNALTLIALIK
jgi:O-antigen/teichoic acid export membrane protein